ncbi:hypothetical protein NO995_07510 [Aestuariibaculum sp. M13]|uniref:hypothetical protein n=1 Tax=unclassified Aestuariibaculum TaxID=2646735 RepID=UPI002159E630|nr:MULTISPECIES: hypothetical protein [unclassified Aestuariibaculum]MCR8667522.1 hypothetical protein [Aestuariibaculum sp. M13]WMI65242.1 hypothetical protein RBH94_14395 [Aestuariibaculum sp. YM273]
MRGFFLVLFFISFFKMFSQNEKSFFVENNNKYVILLDNDVEVANKTIGSTEMDFFVKKDDSNLGYTLVVSKIFEHEFVEGDLLRTNYEDFFLESCGCEILNKEVVENHNLDTYRFKIKVDKKGNKFLGYNDSFVFGDFLYNILFLALEDDFYKYRERYFEIMQSLVVNGKTTINGEY